jgi:hypothetical protein
MVDIKYRMLFILLLMLSNNVYCNSPFGNTPLTKPLLQKENRFRLKFIKATNENSVNIIDYDAIKDSIKEYFHNNSITVEDYEFDEVENYIFETSINIFKVVGDRKEKLHFEYSMRCYIPVNENNALRIWHKEKMGIEKKIDLTEAKLFNKLKLDLNNFIIIYNRINNTR